MARGYGQYCPLALAAEMLCERWTILVISRVIDGCTQFNQIHRGVPRISPSLLSKRLDQLVRSGLIVKRRSSRSAPASYALTPAGAALEPIVEQFAVWGQHWARDMKIDDLDPAFLLWSMHQRLNTAAMPAGRTVIEFEFDGAPTDCRRFWLVNEAGAIDMCLKHPGYEVDIRVASDLRVFVEAWRGFRDLKAEIRARRIKLSGPPALVRQFPDWLSLSSLAVFARKRDGREKRLAAACARTHGPQDRTQAPRPASAESTERPNAGAGRAVSV